MPTIVSLILSAISTTVTAVGLYLYSVGGHSQASGPLAPYSYHLTVGAVIVGVVSCCLWAAAIWVLIRDAMAKSNKAVVKLSDWMNERFDFVPDVRQLTAEEIEDQWKAIYNLVDRSSKEGNAEDICLSKIKMKMHAKVNKESVTGLYDHASNDVGILVGITVVSGLNQAASKAIEDGLLNSGHEISSAHLCKDFRNAAAVYIAGVYAVSKPARAAILMYLTERLKTVANYNKVERIYGRASTAKGRSLLRRRDFQSLSKNPPMYVRYVANGGTNS